MRKLASGRSTVVCAFLVACGILAFACATTQARHEPAATEEAGESLNIIVGADKVCSSPKIDLTLSSELRVSPNCRYDVVGLFDRILPPSEKAEYAADAAAKFGSKADFDVVAFQQPSHLFWIIAKGRG